MRTHFSLAAGRAHTFDETWCKSSQVKSMQLGEGTLYSEQFYAQNILLCLGTINIFKIILPSPSDYSKKKIIQIYSSAVFVLESLL